MSQKARYDIEISQVVGNVTTTVGAWRTDAPIDPSLGYGGHPIGARPKRKALTVWEGRQPFQLTVPLLLSQGRDNGGSNSVDSLRRDLERMATATLLNSRKTGKPTGAEGQPNPVLIWSNLGNLPLPTDLEEGPNGAQWWIEDLAWGAEKRLGETGTSSAGELFYKEVVVTLLEVIADVVIPTNAAHLYKIKKGDKWAKIAARELHDPERQYELREMNGNKTDAWLNAHPGKTIRIPTSI